MLDFTDDDDSDQVYHIYFLLSTVKENTITKS